MIARRPWVAMSGITTALLLLLVVAAAAEPYTMLVCDEANGCDDICTSRTGRLNPQWHLQPLAALPFCRNSTSTKLAI